MSVKIELAALEKERVSLTEKVRDILQAGSIEIFDKYPSIKSFGWNQYTPSFNDGDPCTISVNYYDLIFNGVDVNNDDEEDEELDRADEKEVEAADKKIYDMLNLVPDSTFEELFGNDVTVTITRDGITTEDYDCGY